MSRAWLILAVALGVGLSAAVAQELRGKSGATPAKTTSESGPKAPSSPTSSAPLSPSPNETPAPRGRGEVKEKIRKYAESVLKQHDTNHTGVLEKEEWSKMSERWQAADRNGDGIITLEELIAQMMRPDQRDSERGGETPRSATSRSVRSLSPVTSVVPSWQPAAASPAAGFSVPPTPAFGPTTSSGSLTGVPEKPVDPRAPLVSTQLVMVELVPEAAKAERESSGTASPGLAMGQAIFPLDLAVSNDVILGELRKQGMRGRLEVLCRLQLTAADQQMSSIQTGQSQPQIVGVSLTQFGQSNNIQYTNTGLRVEIQPRVTDRMVSLRINLNDSRLGRAEEGTPISLPAKGETIRAAMVHQFTLQTTVNVPSAKTVVLTGLTEEDGPRRRQLIVLLCPRIISLNPSETVRPAR